MNSSDGHPDVAAEQLLTDAIHRAGKKDGILVEDVSLDIEAVDLSHSSLLDDLKAGNELSPRDPHPPRKRECRHAGSTEDHPQAGIRPMIGFIDRTTKYRIGDQIDTNVRVFRTSKRENYR